MKKLLFIPLMALLTLAACKNDSAEELHGEGDPCDTDNVTFSANVEPLIQSNCVPCHNASNASGGIFLDQYAGVKEVADNGKLMGALNYAAGFTAMPPSEKLPDCDIAAVQAWVDAGAQDD